MNTIIYFVILSSRPPKEKSKNVVNKKILKNSPTSFIYSKSKSLRVWKQCKCLWPRFQFNVKMPFFRKALALDTGILSSCFFRSNSTRTKISSTLRRILITRVVKLLWHLLTCLIERHNRMSSWSRCESIIESDRAEIAPPSPHSSSEWK